MSETTYNRPMSVHEATVLRELDLWQQHEQCANELRDVQRRAHSGHSTRMDDVRHRNLMRQLEVIETAIAALEVEQGAEMSAELAALVAGFREVRAPEGLVTNVFAALPVLGDPEPDSLSPADYEAAVAAKYPRSNPTRAA